MLETYLVHECTLYTQTVDEYNDIRSTNSVNTKCHFRDNNTLGEFPGREEEGSGAMAWFAPGETVNVGDVLTVQGQTYRITQVIAARKLGSAVVQFKKTLLERYDSFVS